MTLLRSADFMTNQFRAQFQIKKLYSIVGLAFLLFGCTLSAGVLLSSIMGTCLDEEGKPMAGAVLRFTDPANGRHFETTSNAEGRFSYIAVEPSRYRLNIFRSHKAPVSFASVDVQWSSQPLLMEIDLKSNSVKITRQVLLAEAFQTELPPAMAAAPNSDEAVVRAINQQLAAAKTFMDAGAWVKARTAAKSATGLDPKRDLPWAWLAGVDCAEASHSSAAAESLLQTCVRNYQYAIAIVPNATYYNNLGAAYSSLKQWNQAAASFRVAAQLNPDHAALYQQNLGAALYKQSEATPSGDTPRTLQMAAEAFTLAAAAVPPIAEAYYWKGLCQLRLAALSAPGSSYQSAGESLQQYLQLAPNGQYAAQSRAMAEGLKDLATSNLHRDAKPSPK